MNITAPTGSPAKFDSPANITLTASASDPDGTVSQVQFFNGGTLLGNGIVGPAGVYTYAWNNVDPGTYSVSAVATDNAGATGTSPAQAIEVDVHTDPGETIVFLHNDMAGSPIAATDKTGAILWKENYRPFGERLVRDPASTPNRQWFAGKAADAETGLSYFGARYYDPVVGRFMGLDSASFSEKKLHSFNRYAYAYNNPYVFVDPDGNEPVQTIGPASSNWFRDNIAGRFIANTIAPFALFTPNNVNPLSGNIENFSGDKKVEAAIGILTLGINGSRAESAAIKELKAFSKEKQALYEMLWFDKKRGGMTKEDFEAYKELNRGLRDPFPESSIREPEAHPDGKNEVTRGSHAHFGGVDHIPIKEVEK